MGKMSKLIALVIFSCFGISYGAEYDIQTITTIMDAYEKQVDSIKLEYTYTYPLNDEQGNLAFTKGTFAQKRSEGYVLLDERKQEGKTWDSDKAPTGIARSYDGQITRYLEYRKKSYGYHKAALHENHNPKLYKTNQNPYYRFYRLNYKTKLTDLFNDSETIKIEGEELVDGFKTIKISFRVKGAPFDSYVWLLPEKNYLLEKNYLPIKYKIVRTADGSNFWQMNWSDFTELAGGIWFPKKTEFNLMDVSEPTTLKVEEIDISPLTKEDFKFEFPAFTHVTDRISTPETHGANRRSGMGADTTAKYKAAAPLNHTVKITRSGSVLKLDYELIGTDGKKSDLWYVHYVRDQSKPTFSVYKDNVKVGGDAFVFG